MSARITVRPGRRKPPDFSVFTAIGVTDGIFVTGSAPIHPAPRRRKQYLPLSQSGRPPSRNSGGRRAPIESVVGCFTAPYLIPNGRRTMRLEPLATLTILTMLLAAAARAAEPIDVGTRLEPMVDDALIEKLDGARLVLHPPTPREVAVVARRAVGRVRLLLPHRVCRRRPVSDVLPRGELGSRQQSASSTRWSATPKAPTASIGPSPSWGSSSSTARRRTTSSGTASGRTTSPR